MVHVVYEDDHLVVIDKPSGMLTHPTAHVRDGTALDAVRAHVGPGVQPKPVHRLDRGTSGLLVFAKQARAHVVLMRHFAERRVEKSYTAVVNGRATFGTLEVTFAVARVGGVWVAAPEGRTAHTTLVALEWSDVRTRVLCVPHTGRTHQLRIHCAAVGHPIAGDPEHHASAERLHLHADALAFNHPATGVRVLCASAAPDGFSWP